MVIDDSAFKPGPKKSPFLYTRKDLDLAHPWDRAAAFIADLGFLIPVLVLAVSPARKWYNEAKFFGDDASVSAALIALIFAYIATTTIWYTAWISIAGTTPGKRLFGLKVIDIWSKAKPRPLHAFLRNLGWIVSFVALGLPWLAIFTNARRRPMHDRISDTVVITTKPERRSIGPGINELATGSALHVMGTGFLLLLILVVTEGWMNSGTKDPSRCRAFEDGLAHISATNASQRIDLALALGEASLLSESCLVSEASKVLWRDRPKSNASIIARAYLARGLAESSDEAKKKYFTKVCENNPTDDACLIAKAEKAILDGDAKSKVSFEPKTDFGRIWKMNHLLLERDYSSLIESNRMQTTVPQLNEYADGLRLLAIKRSGLRDEAVKAASEIFWRSSASTKARVAKTICVDGFTCVDSAREICNWYVNQVPIEPKKITDDSARIHFHAQSCKFSDTNIKYEQMTWNLASEWLASREGLGDAAYKQLLAAERNSWPTWGGLAARKVLIKRGGPEVVTQIEKEWALLKKRQMNETVDEIWEDLGGSLYEKYREMGRFESAFQVGLQIKDRRRANSGFTSEMEKLAKHWDIGVRVPASKVEK